MSLAYIPGEKGLGHWVGADLIGIRHARFLSNDASASLHYHQMYMRVLCAHILTVSSSCLNILPDW